jgi:hypothetical protein
MCKYCLKVQVLKRLIMLIVRCSSHHTPKSRHVPYVHYEWLRNARWAVTSLDMHLEGQSSGPKNSCVFVRATPKATVPITIAHLT